MYNWCNKIIVTEVTIIKISLSFTQWICLPQKNYIFECNPNLNIGCDSSSFVTDASQYVTGWCGTTPDPPRDDATRDVRRGCDGRDGSSPWEHASESRITRTRRPARVATTWTDKYRNGDEKSAASSSFCCLVCMHHHEIIFSFCNHSPTVITRLSDAPLLLPGVDMFFQYFYCIIVYIKRESGRTFWKVRDRVFKPRSVLQLSKKLNVPSPARDDSILWGASVTER